MKHRVRFEIDFDSVHCMYLLDLLYLYDTIYILYCQYPIGTFLTYIRLEKILSGTKFPARSFHTLVCVKVVLPRAGARKISSSAFELQLPAQLPLVRVVWVWCGIMGYAILVCETTRAKQSKTFVR
nr:MAG TPA: hypothetical protein [Caudoviricetes sp.]